MATASKSSAGSADSAGWAGRVSVRIGLLVLVIFVGWGARADGPRANDTNMLVPDYPYPLQSFGFKSQRQTLSMAYMDVAPVGPPVGNMLLLHGKNFSGAYWHQTIDFLVARGFRVVVPDQIGFGQSSMPESYQFSFSQLAANTRALLGHLGITQTSVLGHSMGGMLATEFALQYPAMTQQLLLLNPIGLEDWRAIGVPYVDIDTLLEAEQKKTFASIRAYQQQHYYRDQWTPEYARWAQALANQYAGERREAFVWNMALTADMVLSQPVLYRFPQLQVPTVLMIGTRDRTALGRNLVSAEVAAQMGDYARLGRVAVDMIPDARLIEFDGVGHLPQIEAPTQYLQALAEVLGLPIPEPQGADPSADAAIVYKTPTCQCCSRWVTHLESSGLPVTVKTLPNLSALKSELGVPRSLQSCHTAVIEGYVIEGHVPADDIKRLLSERPDATGLAVPGMPIGSPGMEQGDRKDVYEVILFGNGQQTRYATH